LLSSPGHARCGRQNFGGGGGSDWHSSRCLKITFKAIEKEATGACQNYIVDTSAATFGQCKCGHPKTAHTQVYDGDNMAIKTFKAEEEFKVKAAAEKKLKAEAKKKEEAQRTKESKAAASRAPPGPPRQLDGGLALRIAAAATSGTGKVSGKAGGAGGKGEEEAPPLSQEQLCVPLEFCRIA